MLSLDLDSRHKRPSRLALLDAICNSPEVTIGSVKKFPWAPQLMSTHHQGVLYNSSTIVYPEASVSSHCLFLMSWFPTFTLVTMKTLKCLPTGIVIALVVQFNYYTGV